MRGKMQPKAKPKNAKKTLRRIATYLRHHKFALVIIVICIIISSLAGVAGTYLLKPILNNYVVPFIGHKNPDLSGFVNMLLLMAGIYVVGALCTYAYNRIMINISSDVLRKIRIDMFRHMQDLPIRYYDQTTHGDLMSRYTNDTDTLREMMSTSFPNMISSGLTVLGVFIMMLVISPILTLIVIAILIIMLLVIKKIGGKSGKYFTKQQIEIGTVNGFIEEMIEGQKVIKVFCHEPQIKADFDAKNESLRKTASNAHTFANILMPIMGNLSYLLYSLTAIGGALLTINGMLDVGSIASFLQYTRSFTNPIIQMSQQINAILMGLAGAERIFDLIDEPVESDEGTITLVHANITKDGKIEESEKRTGKWAWKCPSPDGSFTYIELKGDVRFHHVIFGYKENKKILKDVSLYAKPGQKIAFVGSTGAGKTTITNLINRFYDIQEGEILYDGINVKQIKKSDLRRSLGMVLQDTHLFTGTVRDNIRYGKLDATDEEIESAAKLANAHFFISHLPQGYDTVLTADGANLSQGQRQLIAIARAAVADPPVLILDEATSSIDTRTEALIEKGMDKLMDGRTVFVIAHRLSTVRNSNAIMVLEHGEIIERGDHDELLDLRGKYYQLYTGMFELD